MGDRGEDTYRVPSSTAQTGADATRIRLETGTEAEITLEEEASWMVACGRSTKELYGPRP